MRLVPLPSQTRQTALAVLRKRTVSLPLSSLDEVAVQERHGGAAGNGVDIAHPPRAVLVPRRRPDRITRRRPGIAEDRRERRRLIAHVRYDVGHRKGGVVRLVGQVVRRARLERVGAEIAVQRGVEHVEPNDRRVAAVDMFVPGPARRNDEIAFLHRAVLAVDNRRGAAAFDHETQRVHGVAVRARFFAGFEDLQRRREVGGGAAGAVGAVRIDEAQHPPLHRRGRGHRQRRVDQRPNLLPFPVDRRRAAVAGLVRRRVFPQRLQIGGPPGAADFLVGAMAGRRRDARLIHAHDVCPQFRQVESMASSMRK